MNKRNMSIVYSSSLDNLTEYNSSFDKGILRVCYTGGNRNNSFISKETFDRCLHTIYNCPIVCRYDRENDEIGSHDMEFVQGRDGRMSIVNVTNPVGVIPESAKTWYEEVEEDDGSIHEYLCAEALIWRRQEAYQKIKEDGITDESMEITIFEGAMKDGVYVIENFEFTAFCLLGTAEPCYESASLMMFSQDDFKAKLDEMMRDFKESISTPTQPNAADGHFQINSEGGTAGVDKKKELLAQYGLTEAQLNFKLDDFSEDELKGKLEKIKSGGSTGESGGKFELSEQFRNELVTALEAEKTETWYGETSRYCYVDYDANASEVYCYDSSDSWKLCGFNYSMNGDNVVIDFDSRKRKKFSIVDFDEGEQSSVFAKVFEMASNKYSEDSKKWAQKYEEASNKLATIEPELASLRQYKADTEDNAAKQARADVLAQFNDLADVEAFKTLTENCGSYSVEELEEKCYAIRGRKQTGKFALQTPKGIKLPVEKNNKPATAEKEPYGDLFLKYGIE